MKRIVFAAAAVGVSATAATAGGVERSNQSVGVLFEEGRYIEFGFSAGSPDVSGNGDFPTPVGTLNLSSGDMTENFLNFGAAYKADINEQWSYALILNQPYGADVAYPLVSYPFAGSTAELKSNALTALLKYRLPSNVSIYGGLRAQSLEAEAVVNLPTPVGTVNYQGALDRDIEFGYVVGAAYERPEIALRVSLTYNSEIEYSLGTVEQGFAPPENSVTEITTPQSLHLEFQSGVAENTLVFGGIRWVDWTEFSIAPTQYTTNIGSPLVEFRDDRTTFTLGVARRLSEQWAVAGSLSYEDSTGSLTGNLGPTDGFLAASVAGIYTMENTEITAGVTYVDIGDATTTAGANFSGNNAIGFGVKVGYSF